MRSLYTILLLLIIALACREAKTKQIDFCEMMRLDQSYVNNDLSDIEKYQSDRLKRQNLFKTNFEELISYSASEGFPEMGSLKTTGLDSCRNWAVKMTLFHVGQSQPHLFFQPHVIKLFETEIGEGRLESQKLVGPLWEGFGEFKFCNSQKAIMHNALKIWGLVISDLPEIRFIDCNEKSS